jgi:hypothetical protein
MCVSVKLMTILSLKVLQVYSRTLLDRTEYDPLAAGTNLPLLLNHFEAG